MGALTFIVIAGVCVGLGCLMILLTAQHLRRVRQAAAGALDKLGWQPDRSEAETAYWIVKTVEPLIAAL